MPNQDFQAEGAAKVQTNVPASCHPKYLPLDFLVVQWLRIYPAMLRMEVRPLAGELKFLKSCHMANIPASPTHPLRNKLVLPLPYLPRSLLVILTFIF